jgi:hypothetical protein
VPRIGCLASRLAVDTDLDSDGGRLRGLLRPQQDQRGGRGSPTTTTTQLLNAEEAARWTDPFEGDTDLDGWKDHADSNALSRAVMMWGHPKFTSGDDYLYTGPAWWLGAFKAGGAWTNQALGGRGVRHQPGEPEHPLRPVAC